MRNRIEQYLRDRAGMGEREARRHARAIAGIDDRAEIATYLERNARIAEDEANVHAVAIDVLKDGYGGDLPERETVTRRVVVREDERGRTGRILAWVLAFVALAALIALVVFGILGLVRGATTNEVVSAANQAANAAVNAAKQAAVDVNAHTTADGNATRGAIASSETAIKGAITADGAATRGAIVSEANATRAAITANAERVLVRVSDLGKGVDELTKGQRALVDLVNRSAPSTAAPAYVTIVRSPPAAPLAP